MGSVKIILLNALFQIQDVIRMNFRHISTCTSIEKLFLEMEMYTNERKQLKSLFYSNIMLSANEGA